MRALALYFNHYRNFSLAIWLNIIAVFVNASGVMMSFFIAIYLVNVEHFKVMQMAWVFAAGGVGGILGSYVGGWCADRFNHVRICQFSLLLTAIQNILIPFVHHYLAIMVLIFLANFFTFIFRPANSLILFAHCKPSDRTRVYAFFRMAYNLGLACSVVVGGVLAKISFTYFFLFTALMSLLSVGLLQRWFETLNAKTLKRESTAAQKAWFSILRNPAFLILLILFALNALTFCQMRAMYGLYLAHHNGFGVQHLSLIYIINMTLIVLIEVPLMSWLKAVEPLYLTAIGTLFIGAGFAVLPLSTAAYLPALSMILLTVGEILTASPFYVLAMRYADPSCTGLYMGVFQSSFTAGVVLAPVLAGMLYPYWNGEVLWFGCGIVSVLMLFGFWQLVLLQNKGR